MFAELKSTLIAKKVQEMKKNTNFLAKISLTAINFLEKHFGATLLLDVPPILQETDPKLFDAIQLSEKLQGLGIIKKIEKRQKYPDEPHIHRFHITTQKTKNTGSGADFFREDAAIWKAIGEATERNLWATENDVLKNVSYASYQKIAPEALDIFRLAGFSEKQKENNPLLKFNSHTIFGWVTAISLGNARIACPAQLINSHYFQNKVRREKKEPVLRRCITTGVATGQSLEEAVVGGILEVIERDAYIIAYLNKLSPPVIDFENLSFQDEELEKVYKMFKRYDLEVFLIKLPTDFSASVISAVILDRSGQGPAFTLGNSAKADLKSAVLGALGEAFSIRLSLKKNWEEKKEIPLPGLKNFNQFDRMLYWAKPENAPKLAFMTQGEKIQIDLSSETNFFNHSQRIKDQSYYQDRLKELKDELQKKAYSGCYVELSNREVCALGLRSVQVVIPELQPIHLEEDLPYFGGKRLQEIPRMFGYLPLENLNEEPHPFG